MSEKTQQEDNFEEPLINEEVYRGQELQEGVVYLTKDGAFKYVNNDFVTMISKIPDYKSSVDLKLQEAVYSYNVDKIPVSIINQAYSFFKKVYDELQSEAVVLMWFNPESKEWALEIPPQKVSAAHLDYDREKETIESFKNDGYIEAGSVHSHGNMAAFHSSGDDEDEFKFDGIHITIGTINSNPQFSQRIVSGSIVSKCEFSDVIDNPEIKGGVEEVEVPEEWFNKVQKKVYKAPVKTKSSFTKLSKTNTKNKNVKNKTSSVTSSSVNTNLTGYSDEQINKYINQQLKGFNLSKRQKRNYKKYIDKNTMEVVCPECLEENLVGESTICTYCGFDFIKDYSYESYEDNASRGLEELTNFDNYYTR